MAEGGNAEAEGIEETVGRMDDEDGGKFRMGDDGTFEQANGEGGEGMLAQASAGPPPGSPEGLRAMLEKDNLIHARKKAQSTLSSPRGRQGKSEARSPPKEGAGDGGAAMEQQRGNASPRQDAKKEPFFIGVAGGTASGKTTVCNRIMQELQQTRVALVSQDSFYRPLTAEERANVENYNFDHPDAIDQDLLLRVLDTLKNRESAEVPVYDFKTHSRTSEVETVAPADVVILEGILVMSMEEVRQECNMRIFVDTDDDVRLARRIKRDTAERGRNVDSVIEQYTKFVKPMFDAYVLPSKKFAHVIIPWASGENSVAINLIVEHIRTKLGQDDLRACYSNLSVLPGNFQTRGMHTIIRDARTGMHDFVFYSDRLFRLILEHALSYLPFHHETVTTPADGCYKGFSFSQRLTGISVIRSGEAMENALRATCKGVKIGKVLIRRHDSDTGSEVAYHKLPVDIQDRYCLLMDPILATGNSASAAVRLLLRHGVRQERIVFVTLLAAPRGIRKICGEFPHLQVVTSEIDESCTERGAVLPGIGEFGDRYFGTSPS